MRSPRKLTPQLPRLKRIAAVAALAGALAGVAGAGAGTSNAASETIDCQARTTTQAFAPWGDFNWYFQVSNGRFEGTTQGWTMHTSVHGTPGLVNDQEPWRINGAGDRFALSLPAWSTAVAPTLCVMYNEDLIRFFYRDPGVAGSTLLVGMESSSANGRIRREVRIPSSSAGWKVSPAIQVPSVLSNDSQWLSITFTPVDTAATWRVDDVMVDPWKTR